jgi:hypothetical protein
MLLCVGGERGTIVRHGLLTIEDTVVPDGCHAIGAALVEFASIFLPPSFCQGM